MAEIEPFHTLDATFALIVRGSVEDMNYAVELINENTDLNLIYQRTSSGELYITENNPIGE